MKLIAIAAALALILTGCATTPEAAEVPRAVTIHHRPIEHVGLLRVSIEYAGDSITTLEYLGQPRGELSWLNHLTPSAIAIGGYAESGRTTSDIYSRFAPIDGADVLVIMLGTNDTRQHYALGSSMTYMSLIAAASGLPANRIVVSAIGPSNDDPAASMAYNATLAATAEANGWMFVDPWVAVRASDGTYNDPAATYDGVHPTGVTQITTGAILSQAAFDAAYSKRGL